MSLQTSPRVLIGSYKIEKHVYELNVLVYRGPNTMQPTMHFIQILQFRLEETIQHRENIPTHWMNHFPYPFPKNPMKVLVALDYQKFKSILKSKMYHLH